MKNIIIVVVALVVLGGGAYFLTQDSTILPGGDNMALIRDAYMGKGSVVCDFVDPGYEYRDDEEVTVYIKAGAMRLFPKELEGEYEASILIKDGYYYFWSEEGGMKMEIEEGETGDGAFVPFAVEDEELYVFTDEEFQLDCRREAIDDSMFEVPENIEFIDMSEIPTEWEDQNGDLYEDINWEDIDIESFNIDPEDLKGIEGFDF